MFGPKKTRVSKEDLKKSVVNANKKLVSANKILEEDIKTNKENLKTLDKDYSSYRRALEDIKEMQILAENELNGTQFNIAEADTSLKEALSKLASLSEESNSLAESNKKLQVKHDKLTESIKSLKEKESELKKYTESLNQIKREEADGQETLELLAIELNDLEGGVESYISRKSAAEGEFNALKAKIEREKVIATKELNSIKERMAEATLGSGQEMGRLDKAIAERIEEMQDMDSLMAKKSYEFVTVQSAIKIAENTLKDAEEAAEYIAKKAQDKVTKIKGDFKDWKVEALNDIAKLKLKGKIENIDKAGLKELFSE